MSNEPKKDGLKKLMIGLIKDLHKLNVADNMSKDNSETTRARDRIRVVAELEKAVRVLIPVPTHEVIGYSDLGGATEEQRLAQIDSMKARINALIEEQADKILHTALDDMENILDSKVNEYVQHYGYRPQDLSKKSDLLKEHSFSHRWIFNFIARFVKLIRETLDVQTSSERIVADAKKHVPEAKNALNQLRDEATHDETNEEEAFKPKP